MSALIGLFIILLMTGIVFLVIRKQFNYDEVIEAISNANLLWLIPGILCMLVFSLGEAINIYQGLKVAGGNPKFSNALKYAFAGFFFSSITPSASGGQPAQLFYMNHDHVFISHGSFALLLELIGFEIASILLGFSGLLISLFSDINVFDGSGLVWLTVVGFSVNFLLLAFLLLVMFSRKAVKPISFIAIKILSLVSKNSDNQKKVFTAISQYRWAAIKALKNKSVFFNVIGVSILRLAAYHLITYFVYRALGLNAQSFIEIALLQGLLFTSVSCIPLPGSSGAMEGGFGILFKSIFPSSLLGSAIILLRAINFALPLIYTGTFLFLCRTKKTRE